MFPQTPVAATPVRSTLLQKVLRQSMWALALGLAVSSAAAQTVTANFDSRSGTTHSIPPRVFGINDLTTLDDNTINQVQQAGITEARTMANIPVVYASQT